MLGNCHIAGSQEKKGKGTNILMSAYYVKALPQVILATNMVKMDNHCCFTH